MTKTKSPTQQLESDITKGIRRLLKFLGVMHWKNWSGPMTFPKGIPDILGILPAGVAGGPGRFLAIEVKTDKGRVSPDQEKFMELINRSGGLAFVARSVDDVIDTLGVRDRFLF